MPKKGFADNISKFRETQDLLNMYKQQTVALRPLSEKLKGKKGFDRLDSIIKVRARTEGNISSLSEKIVEIDL
jgi:hypothetical protein